MRPKCSLLAAALLAALAPKGAPASAAPPTPCTTVVVSPTYTVDRTIVCFVNHFTYRTTAYQVSVSHDRGATWTTRTPTGLPAKWLIVGAGEVQDNFYGLGLSSDYAHDRTTYARFSSSGLFASIDDGATFTAVDPADKNLAPPIREPKALPSISSTGTGADVPVPAVLLPGSPAAAFVGGSHVAVAGSGSAAVEAYVVIGAGQSGQRVLEFARRDQPQPDGSLYTTIVSPCTAAIACPVPSLTYEGSVFFADAATDPRAGGTAVVIAADRLGSGNPTYLHVSRDRGETFTAVTLPGGSASHVALAVVPQGRATVIALATDDVQAGWRFWTSRDLGRHWRQRVPRSPADVVAARSMTATPDGRLLVATSARLLCSRDAGGTFSERCR